MAVTSITPASVHRPSCPTWRHHLDRALVDIGDRYIDLRSFCERVIWDYEDETLADDPEHGVILREFQERSIHEDELQWWRDEYSRRLAA